MGCCPSQTDPVGAAHRQQLFKNCSHMAPYHGVHPPGANCSNTGPPRAAAPPRPPCSCVGSSPQAAAPARGLLLWGLSMGRSLLQATSTCSTGGSSTGCSVEICSMWDPWAAGGQRAPPGASPQAAGELLLCAWSTSCPASALTLVSAGLVFTPCSPSCCCAAFFFFFLYLLSQRPNQLSSGQQWVPFWSQLELALI